MIEADRAAAEEYTREFFEACRYGELEDAQMIYGHPRLRELIDFASLEDPETGNTPAMFAAANGEISILEFLLTTVQIQNLNTKNSNGNSAIHWASLNGHPNCVQLLIDHGAIVTEQNGFGRTPFDEAYANQKMECCEILAREEVRVIKLEDGESDS